MHKVNILSIFFVFILWSCGSSKSKAYPEYVIGTKNDSTQKMFPMDSLFIVTPNIQINKVLSYSSEPDYEKRKSIRDLVIEMLKYELLNNKFIIYL